MTQYQSPDAGPKFKRAASSKRRQRSPGDNAHWQIGMVLVPPAAAIGLALSVFGYLQPELALLPSLRALAFLMVATCAVSLGLMLYDVRPSSTRLRRKKVWLAIVLAIITIPAVLLMDRRARHSVSGETVIAPMPTNLDLPPSER